MKNWHGANELTIWIDQSEQSLLSNAFETLPLHDLLRFQSSIDKENNLSNTSLAKKYFLTILISKVVVFKFFPRVLKIFSSSLLFQDLDKYCNQHSNRKLNSTNSNWLYDWPMTNKFWTDQSETYLILDKGETMNQQNVFWKNLPWIFSIFN